MKLPEPVMKLHPKHLKKLSGERLSDLIDKEAVRARAKVDELQQRYPSAGPRELSQHLIDHKKNLASMMGGVTGGFGGSAAFWRAEASTSSPSSRPR